MLKPRCLEIDVERNTIEKHAMGSARTIAASSPGPHRTQTSGFQTWLPVNVYLNSWLLMSILTACSLKEKQQAYVMKAVMSADGVGPPQILFCGNQITLWQGACLLEANLTNQITMMIKTKTTQMKTTIRTTTTTTTTKKMTMTKQTMKKK